jgi:hypothetical protein
VITAGQTASNTIQITFSEPVLGAGDPWNYRVEGDDGNLIAVRAVSYSENQAVITFADTPPSGKITVSCPGITDISMEKNAVNGSTVVNFESAIAESVGAVSIEGANAGTESAASNGTGKVNDSNTGAAADTDTDRGTGAVAGVGAAADTPGSSDSDAAGGNSGGSLGSETATTPDPANGSADSSASGSSGGSANSSPQAGATGSSGSAGSAGTAGETENDVENSAIWFFGVLLFTLLIVLVTLGVIKSRSRKVNSIKKIYGGAQSDSAAQFGVAQSDSVAQYGVAQSDAAQCGASSVKAPELLIRIIAPNGNTTDFPLAVKGSAFVGRANGNDLVLNYPALSRQHFVIEAREGGFMVQNLSRTDGTALNGAAIETPQLLCEGDRIEAGGATFIILTTGGLSV